MKRTILLKSFLVEALNHWLRYLIIFLVLLGLIAGASFLMNRATPSNSLTEIEPLEKQMSNASASIAEIDSYFDNSLVAKYNPLQVPTYTIFSGLDYSDPDDLEKIAGQIYVVSMQPDVYDFVRKTIKTEAPNQYLNEIMNIAYDIDTNVARVNIYYEDEAIAKQLAHFLQSKVIDYVETNSDGAVKARQISEVFTSVENTVLRDKLTRFRSDVDRLNSLIATNKTKIAQIQSDNQTTTPRSELIKTILFSGVVAGMILAGILALKATSNRANLLASDIRETYQVPLLFGLDQATRAKRFEKSETQFLSLDEAKKRLASIAQLFSEKEVLLLGSHQSEWSDKLASASNQLIASGGLFNDKANLDKLRQVDQVILLVDPYITSHQAFQEQIRVLKQLDKKIIGTVII